MSAPSAMHEERREDLATIFRLAGMTSPAHLQWWLRPDVSLATPCSRMLGIGDAKATERPGEAATLRRLVGYVRTAKRWHATGWGIHMSLAVGPEDGAAWLAQLRRAWTLGGLRPTGAGTLSIAPDLEVVTLSTGRCILAAGMDSAR